MPVLVKNCEPGPTVFSDAANDLFVQWEGDGDAEGRDVQEVSDAVLKHPNFTRNVRKGVFKLLNVNEDEANALLAPAAAQASAQREAERAAIDATLEASNVDNDYVEVKCLISGEVLYLTGGDLKNAPPLAPRFADRAGEFTKTDIPGMFNSKGEPEFAWVRNQQA
jgi:hypothetical protein